MRNILKWLSALVLLANLTACGTGGTSTTAPTISASVISGGNTATSCTGLTTGKQCVIQLTYNLQGNADIALSYTPLAISSGITTNPSFIQSFTVCQNNVVNASGTSSQSTCTVTITYTSIGGAGTQNTLAFVLGSTTSNSITIQGN